MANWSRVDATPDVQRFNLQIFRQDMPEVADYLWELPWGTSTEVIRSLMIAGHAALKAAGQLPNVDVPVQAKRRGKVVGAGAAIQPATAPVAPQPASAYQSQPAQQPAQQPQPVAQPAYQPQAAYQAPAVSAPTNAMSGDAMSEEDMALLADLDSGLS